MAKCQRLRTAPYCLVLFKKRETEKRRKGKSHQAENGWVMTVFYSPESRDFFCPA